MKKIVLWVIALLVVSSTTLNITEAKGFSSSRGGGFSSSRSSSSSSASRSFSSSSSSRSSSTPSSSSSTSTASRSYSSPTSSASRSTSTASRGTSTANRSYSTPSQNTRVLNGWGGSVGYGGNWGYGGWFGSYMNGYMMGSMLHPYGYWGLYSHPGYYYGGFPSFWPTLGYMGNVGGFTGGLLFFLVWMIKILGTATLAYYSYMRYAQRRYIWGTVFAVLAILLLTI